MFYSGKRSCIRTNRLYSGKSGCIRANDVVLEQEWLYSVKVVVFGQRGIIPQSGCVRAKSLFSGKVVVFAQKLLYSGKSGCIRSKLLYLVKSGCIRIKVVVFG